MQAYSVVESILNDPCSTFTDFENGLISSQIYQQTYLNILLRNIVVKEDPGQDFDKYVQLLVSFSLRNGKKSADINYIGYKDKISILMNACAKSTSKSVEILLRYSDLNVDYMDSDDMNAAFYAIRNTNQAHTNLILTLLFQKQINLKNSHTPNHYTLLFHAVSYLKITTVQFLLTNHVDPNIKLKSNGNTSLHHLMELSSKQNQQIISRIVLLFFKFKANFYESNNQNINVFKYGLLFGVNIQQIVLNRNIGNQLVRLNEKQVNQDGNYSINDKDGNYNIQEKYNESETGNSDKCQIISDKCQIISMTEQTKIDDTVSNFSEVDHYQLQPSQNNYSEKDYKGQFQYKEQRSEESQKSEKILYKSNNFNDCQSVQDVEDYFMDDQLQQSETSQEIIQYQNVQAQQFEGSDSSYQSIDNQLFVESQHINYTGLTEEIIQYSYQCENTHREAWANIQPFFDNLNKIAFKYELFIEIVGSFATGLWFPYSDIDITLIPKHEEYINFEMVLEKVYKKLKKRMFQYGIEGINFVKSNKITSIKIEMNDYYERRDIQVTIFYKKNSCKMYANYINEVILGSPCIKPLFYTFKRICEAFNVEDCSKGGLKSYALFLMIQCLVKSLPNRSLGEIFLHVCLYYGFYFEYDFIKADNNFKAGNNVKADNNFKSGNYVNSDNHYSIARYQNIHPPRFQTQLFEPPMKFSLIDPLNSKNNVGGLNTKTEEIRNMFRSLYYALHLNTSQNGFLTHFFQLATIL